MNIELCIDCDEPTGRAGMGEDSLYSPDRSEGPFCIACWEDGHAIDERAKKTSEYKFQLAAAAARNEVYDKILCDDEWWEEVSLEPYNGDVRQAIRDAIDAAKGE